MEAITAVNETCATMETYAALLKEETAAVREMRMADVTRLGDTKEALAKNLCRCGTHARIIRAVQRAADYV